MKHTLKIEFCEETFTHASYEVEAETREEAEEILRAYYEEGEGEENCTQLASKVKQADFEILNIS